jgi:hypothetical protein
MSSAQQIEQSQTDDLQTIKWAGWSILAVLVASWAGWVSLLAISNSARVDRQEERENNHFERLRDDIRDVKEEVVALRKSAGVPLSVSH